MQVDRQPLESTRTGKEKFDQPAGQFQERNFSGQKDENKTISNRGDLRQPKVAGKNTMIGEEVINVARLDQVEALIKVEKPSAPIRDSETTYNKIHNRPGYPVHYPPQPAKDPVPKIEAPEEVYPANKRHPFGVKSRRGLILEEPLHEKSKTMLTLKVPDHLEPDQLKSELAKKGYHVVKSYFEHNTITNERTGNGFVQVRTANPRYLQTVGEEIKNIGVKVSKKQEPLPNQNLVSPRKR